MADWDDWDHDNQVQRREVTDRSGGLRHGVAVPAYIESSRDGVFDAQIADLSKTGMYLRLATFIDAGDLDTLALGSVVRVEFAPDYERKPDQKVQMSGEVVRRDPHGIGLRFVEVTKEHLDALRSLAVRAVQSRMMSGDGGKARPRTAEAERNARKVMTACLKVVERRLPTIIWTLRTDLVNRLLAMDSKDPAETGNTARSDAERIEEKGTAIGRTIERRVLQTFAEVAGLDATQQLVLAHVKRALSKAGPSDDGKMDLMGKDAVDNTVAMTSACEGMETELSGRSFDVNVRLANVLGRRIDDIENPLVPAVMGRILWQSVTEYCASKPVHRCLYLTLVRDLTPLLMDLYDQLDETLDAHDVPHSFWTGSDSYWTGPAS